jgi:hypothetical protein
MDVNSKAAFRVKTPPPVYQLARNYFIIPLGWKHITKNEKSRMMNEPPRRE